MEMRKKARIPVSFVCGLALVFLTVTGCPLPESKSLPPAFSTGGGGTGMGIIPAEPGTERQLKLLLTALPFKLAGESDVNNVKIVWSRLADVDRYAIFRDGGEIGTATGDTWDDYAPGIGTHSYSVKGYAEEELIVESAAVTAATFTSLGSPAATYDNTRGGNSLGQPSGHLINGTYYQYSSSGSGSGSTRTETIRVRTSADGLTNWSGYTTLTTISNAKLEGVGSVYNPVTGKVIFAAHRENGSNYEWGRVYLAEIDPAAGTLTEKFDGRPFGYDCRDMSVFIDDGSAYILAAINTNSHVAIFKLNSEWNGFAENGLVNIVFRDQYRETPSIVRKGDTYYFFGSKASGWYPSQVQYATSKDIRIWTALADVGNAATFRSQSNGIGVFGTNEQKTYGLYSYHWGQQYPAHAESSSYPRLLPVSLNAGFATVEYFDTVEFYTDYGLVGVQTGKYLSLGKPVTASSASETNGNAALITDGADLSGSGYFQGGVFPYNVVIDLEQTARIKEIDMTTRLVGGSETAWKYKLEGSANGTDYTVLYDGTANNWRVGFTVDKITDTTPYRYVKMTVNTLLDVNHSDGAAEWADGLIELAVFGEWQ
jgi:hypothetical protein